jgi:hypothetical protein
VETEEFTASSANRALLREAVEIHCAQVNLRHGYLGSKEMMEIPGELEIPT